MIPLNNIQPQFIRLQGRYFNLHNVVVIDIGKDWYLDTDNTRDEKTFYRNIDIKTLTSPNVPIRLVYIKDTHEQDFYSDVGVIELLTIGNI